MLNDLNKQAHVCTLCIFDILVNYFLYMSCDINPLHYTVLTVACTVITIQRKDLPTF